MQNGQGRLRDTNKDLMGVGWSMSPFFVLFRRIYNSSKPLAGGLDLDSPCQGQLISVLRRAMEHFLLAWTPCRTFENPSPRDPPLGSLMRMKLSVPSPRLVVRDGGTVLGASSVRILYVDMAC